uniref:Uncharacterized protein n=1 Tax=Anguilla anguilla TaxID=7936 RepID=A0A0E9Q156_ANGAN
MAYSKIEFYSNKNLYFVKQ